METRESFICGLEKVDVTVGIALKLLKPSANLVAVIFTRTTWFGVVRIGRLAARTWPQPVFPLSKPPN